MPKTESTAPYEAIERDLDESEAALRRAFEKLETHQAMFPAEHPTACDACKGGAPEHTCNERIRRAWERLGDYLDDDGPVDRHDGTAHSPLCPAHWNVDGWCVCDSIDADHHEE